MNAFAAVPIDMFLDYGNRIRSRSCAAQTFIIQFACGRAGYLPAEKAQKGGNYGAYVANSKVGYEAEDLRGSEQLKKSAISLKNKTYKMRCEKHSFLHPFFILCNISKQNLIY